MRIFNKFSVITLVISTALAVLGLTGPIAALAVTAGVAPSLGVADSYAVWGKAGVTNSGVATHIWGNVGADSLSNITGLDDATQVDGTIIAPTPATVQTAISDAYTALSTPPQGAITDISLTTSKAVVPGVYLVKADETLNGTITLNGEGVYIFQSASAYHVADSAQVVLTNGATACNVFWRIYSTMTIGTNAQMVGTIITSQEAITLNTGASLQGRALSGIAAVTLLSNIITEPTCAAAAEVVPPASSRTNNTITVIKQVINDNGGTAKFSDFPLFINGNPVDSGESVSLAEGIYTVTETGRSGYTRTFTGDCDATGKVNHGGMNTRNNLCTVINNDIGAPAVAVIPPLIDVVKVPSPLALPAGPGPVTYTYTARNIGTVPMTDVTLVGDTCSPIILVSGDTNGDSKLDVNETWIYRCAKTLTETHTNTVVATGHANGLTAIDVASATVVVGLPIVPPLIHVIKVPSPLALPAGAGKVTYTYTVTNPGTAPLSNVSITDDKCTGLPGRVVGHPGDLNKNDLLESNESWSFTCQTNLTETTTNTGMAEGSANGLIARDFALATVVVAVPKLPKTGLPPQEKSNPWNIVLSAAILMLVSTSLVLVLKKRKI